MLFFFVWFAALFALAAIVTMQERPLVSAFMAFTSFVCVGTVAMAVM